MAKRTLPVQSPLFLSPAPGSPVLCHAHPHLAPDELPLRDARHERDPDAAADAAQSRRPVSSRDWRIDVSADCRLDQHEDAFGNITHAFTADGPLDELTVLVEGEVETRDTQGVVRGTVERFPPSLYLRETAADRARRRHRRLRRGEPRRRRRRRARAPACTARTPARRYGLRHRPHPHVRPPRRKPSRSSAASARISPTSSSRRRAASAFRRAMSAAISTATTASASRTPATPGRRPSCPSSAGWRSIRRNGICATDAHVRVAVGLDYLGAAPVRGTRYGGAGEMLAVKVSGRPGGAADAELKNAGNAIAGPLPSLAIRSPLDRRRHARPP